MKKILFFLIFSLIIVHAAVGQIIKPATNNLLNNSVFFVKESYASNLLIKQISTTGIALLTTEQELVFSNKAYISQTGTRHRTTISQKGNNNEANLWSDGSFTNTNAIQKGNNNSITSKFQNYTIQYYSTELQQTGDRNSIELTVLGNKLIPDITPIVSIRQNGNNLEFSGQYDSPAAPVDITQKSGIDGAGMIVNVTSSAFSFPMK